MIRDALRDAWIAERGVRTLRLPARLAVENVEAALALIAAETGSRKRPFPS